MNQTKIKWEEEISKIKEWASDDPKITYQSVV